MTQPPNPEAALYHLTVEIKRQNRLLEDIQEELGDVKTSVAVLESRPQSHHHINRKKDTTIGGTVGGLLTAVIYIVYEFFKNKG